MNNSIKFRHSAYSSHIEFSEASNLPRVGAFLDRSRYNIDLNQAMVQAMTDIINNLNFNEVVDICVNGSSISFHDIVDDGVITVLVVRNSLESFSVTTIRGGSISYDTVETLDGFFKRPDEFETLIMEVCKDYWIKW